jgi:crotonobetainyl-CoA hydratase
VGTPAATAERDGAVLLITLNRPDALNACNAELAGIVGAALEELEADPSLRVGVITGAGRAFCAGMDLKAFLAGEDVAAPGHPEWGFAGVGRHFVAKPLIAAVNGLAMGGGAELALACDLIVASRTARIGLPEVTLGLYPAGGGVLRLTRQIPYRLAMEMILTGTPIDAERALRIGLVNQVVEPDQVLPAALELAGRIAANGPLAVQASKQLVRDCAEFGDDWSDAIWAVNDAVFERLRVTADAVEGATAFTEKRPPTFTGR